MSVARGLPMVAAALEKGVCSAGGARGGAQGVGRVGGECGWQDPVSGVDPGNVFTCYQGDSHGCGRKSMRNSG